jgi:shikimate dehydrogenase
VVLPERACLPGERYLVGLVGTGIATSLSPALHEREADHLGLRYLYQVIELENDAASAEAVGSVLTSARRLGFRGLNVTHPFKRSVLPYLDELAPEAATVGAVNAVVFEADRAVGYNTDVFGFAQSFVRGLPGAAIGLVVVLGAGGAGAAVTTAMLGLGAGRVVIVDPDSDRARELASSVCGRFGAHRAAEALPDRLPEHLAHADGLINASPVGMTAYPGIPIDPELLKPDIWVADVVYRPLETQLLAEARCRNCRRLDGGGMVVFQAAASFEIFTGRKPNLERMLDHLASLVGKSGDRRAVGA